MGRVSEEEDDAINEIAKRPLKEKGIGAIEAQREPFQSTKQLIKLKYFRWQPNK